MQEAVSQVLSDRAREADGIGKMVLVSFLAHATLIAVIVVLPESWRSASVEVEVTPMTITLGGAQGPDTGGMTPLGGRAVQTIAPDVKPRIETRERPAPKPPEMVAPSPTAKPAPKTPAKKVENPADKSSSRKPTSGTEIKPGTAATTSGVPFGRGLSTTSGGTGEGAYTDYANFCCPSYLSELQATIKRNWSPNQGAAGTVQVKFTVQRDGTITDIEIEKPSNIALLDLASQRALLVTKKVAPLPREFTENRLTIHLIFEYQR